MAIPDYQSIMLPLLKFTGDGQEHTIREAIDYLSKDFNLTEDEFTELLPSGGQRVFHNRIAWAATYLRKAMLLESNKRSYIHITDRGRTVLSDNIEKVNVSYLERFTEFVEFRKKRKDNSNNQQNIEGDNDSSSQTPEEILEDAYVKIRQGLAQEILEKVKECSPDFFERLVVDLLIKMGYGGSRRDAGKAIGKSGDEGIDGIIKEDRLGLDIIYIQAKRWGGVIGRPEIQKFVGALAGQRAKKGVFITTSHFSNDALNYVSSIESKIVLIDGDQLAQYMIDFNIGVSTVVSYEIKKIDSDYFIDE